MFFEKAIVFLPTLSHSRSPPPILTYSHQFLSKVSPDSPMLIPLQQFFTNISVSPSTLYHSHTLLIAPTYIHSLWPALTHLHLIVSKTSPHSPTLIHLRLFFTKINPHLSILLHFHPIFTKISLHLQTVTHSQPFFLKVSPWPSPNIFFVHRNKAKFAYSDQLLLKSAIMYPLWPTPTRSLLKWANTHSL